MVRKPDPGATDPPNGAEGGDAEEVPVTKEGSVGGFLWPMERVVGKEDTWKAGDIKASESMPRVEEPVDDRLNLGAGEEGVGDILCGVGCVAARGGASSKSRISGSRLSGADMGEVSLTANGAMKNAPRRNYEGGVDGRIEERKPDTGEGSAEVWGREVASEGHAMYACGARGARLQIEPRWGGVEGDGVVVEVRCWPELI